VWAFVEQYDNWADLFPGYQQHRLAADGASIWTVRGDVGIVSRLVELEVRPGARDAGDGVTFAVRGTSEDLAGQGRFAVDAITADRSRLTFTIDIVAGGLLGPVVNALLAPRLAAMLAQFAPALARRIEGAPAAGRC
jgi:carbon monoxide dehydrogenase subunit G